MMLQLERMMTNCSRPVVRRQEILVPAVVGHGSVVVRLLDV